MGLTMDPKASQLAMKMLRWEEAQLFANELRAEIENAVMEIKHTQTVGNVRASYSGGRKGYDYAAAAMMCPALKHSILEQFTITPEPRTDWRKVCEYLKIEKADIPSMQSPPSVRVKLLSE